MFESDQSDLHAEIAELRQSAPAAVQPQPEAAPDPSFYETRESEPKPIESSSPEEKVETKKRPFPFLLFSFGAIGIIALVLLFLTRPKKSDEPLPGDLGPGVVASAGLRGHLLTQWAGNAKTGSLQYQLRLEPIGPVQAPGFKKVTANPLAPYSINVRVLDQAGFAMCGKEILFRFDPRNAPITLPPTPHPVKKSEAAAAAAAAQAARKAQLDSMIASEADREHGKDIFENQADADGDISAVNARGTLPCSPDQYKRAYYWDFSTNFPTIEEQFALVDPKAAAAARREKEGDSGSDSRDSRRRGNAKKLQSAYYIQGDDRITGFDPLEGILEATSGKNFTIPNKPEQAIVANWAHSYSLIHYKCDQHANCALTSAGGVSVVYGRISE
jgi:hypothetical protein